MLLELKLTIPVCGCVGYVPLAGVWSQLSQSWKRRYGRLCETSPGGDPAACLAMCDVASYSMFQLVPGRWERGGEEGVALWGREVGGVADSSD